MCRDMHFFVLCLLLHLPRHFLLLLEGRWSSSSSLSARRRALQDAERERSNKRHWMAKRVTSVVKNMEITLIKSLLTRTMPFVSDSIDLRPLRKRRVTHPSMDRSPTSSDNHPKKRLSKERESHREQRRAHCYGSGTTFRNGREREREIILITARERTTTTIRENEER